MSDRRLLDAQHDRRLADVAAESRRLRTENARLHQTLNRVRAVVKVSIARNTETWAAFAAALGDAP